MTSCCKEKENGKKWKNITCFKNGASKQCNCSKENPEVANNGCAIGISEEITAIIEPPDGGFWVR